MIVLKCKGCRRFTWGSFCYAEGEGRKDCPSHGDETKCELYPERRKNAQERAEAELSRRIPAKWFDFEKQKPVHGDSVLGLDDEGSIEVYQYSDEWSSCLMRYDGNIKVFNITHWTLLPKPPTQPLTNADRIRAMSDELLASQMVVVVEETIKALTDLDVPDEILNEVRSQLLERLKQPAEVDNDRS